MVCCACLEFLGLARCQVHLNFYDAMCVRDAFIELGINGQCGKRARHAMEAISEIEMLSSVGCYAG